jgi:ABC-type phosphate/phosphonate transport system substrate-binding protein
MRLTAPDEDSITSMMVRATLRDAGLGPQDVRISYTRYQDAVPFAVETGITHAGATAANKLVKGWTDKGGKVLGKSRPVPIKHLIGGGSLNAEQLAQVRDYLLTLDGSDDGRKKLETTKYTGFDRFEEPAMLALGTWLGL